MTPCSLRHVLLVAGVIVTLCKKSDQELYEQQKLDLELEFHPEPAKDKFVDFPSSNELYNGDLDENKEADSSQQKIVEAVQFIEVNRIRRVRQAYYAGQSTYVPNTGNSAYNASFNYTPNQQSTYSQTSHAGYPNTRHVNNTQSGSWSQYPSHHGTPTYTTTTVTNSTFSPQVYYESHPSANRSHSYPTSLNDNLPHQGYIGYPSNNYIQHSSYPTNHSYPLSHAYTSSQLAISSNSFPPNQTSNYPINTQTGNSRSYPGYPPNHLNRQSYPSGNNYYPQSVNSTYGIGSNKTSTSIYPGNQLGNSRPYPGYPSSHLPAQSYPSTNHYYPSSGIGANKTSTSNYPGNQLNNSRPFPGYPSSHLPVQTYTSRPHYYPQSVNSTSGIGANKTNISNYPGDQQGYYRPHPGYPSSHGHSYPSFPSHTHLVANSSIVFRPNYTQAANAGQGNFNQYPGGLHYPSNQGAAVQSSNFGPNYNNTQQGHSHGYPSGPSGNQYPNSQSGNFPQNSAYGYNSTQNLNNKNQGYSQITHDPNSNLQPTGPQYTNYNNQGNLPQSSYSQYPNSNPNYSPQNPVDAGRWNAGVRASTNVTYQTYPDPLSTGRPTNQYPSNIPNTNDNHFYYPSQNKGSNVDPNKVNPQHFA